MNNEPVAWMSTTGNNFVSKKTPSYVKVGTNDWIPLYTHPADLTDEEIYEIVANITGFQTPHASNMANWETINKFARAILRKAQEK